MTTDRISVPFEHVGRDRMCLGVKNYFAGDPFAADTFRLVVLRYGPTPAEYLSMAQWR